MVTFQVIDNTYVHMYMHMLLCVQHVHTQTHIIMICTHMNVIASVSCVFISLCRNLIFCRGHSLCLPTPRPLPFPLPPCPPHAFSNPPPPPLPLPPSLFLLTSLLLLSPTRMLEAKTKCVPFGGNIMKAHRASFL